MHDPELSGVEKLASYLKMRAVCYREYSENNCHLDGDVCIKLCVLCLLAYVLFWNVSFLTWLNCFG